MMNYVDHKDELVYNVKKLYRNLDLMSDAYPNLSNWIMYKMNAGVLAYDADVTQGALRKLAKHQQTKGYFKDCSFKKQPKYNLAGYKYEIIPKIEVKEKVEYKIFRADSMNSFWTTFKIFLQICMAEELGLTERRNSRASKNQVVVNAVNVLKAATEPEAKKELKEMTTSKAKAVLNAMKVLSDMTVLDAIVAIDAIDDKKPDAMDAIKVLVTKNIPDDTKVLDAMNVPGDMKVLAAMTVPDATKVLDAMNVPNDMKILAAMTVPDTMKVLDAMKVPDAVKVPYDMIVPNDKFRVANNTNVWLYHFADNFPSVYKNPENIFILDKFEEFAKLTHTIGNFLIVPTENIKGYDKKGKLVNIGSFNVARGSKIPSINDYFDLTLKEIEKYYIEKKEIDKSDLTEIEVEKFYENNRDNLLIQGENRHWLEIYGTFKKFIDCNSLTMYVNKITDENDSEKYTYTCKSLFGKLSRDKPEPQNGEEIKKFLDSVIENIKARNEAIEGA